MITKFVKLSSIYLAVLLSGCGRPMQQKSAMIGGLLVKNSSQGNIPGRTVTPTTNSISTTAPAAEASAPATQAIPRVTSVRTAPIHIPAPTVEPLFRVQIPVETVSPNLTVIEPTPSFGVRYSTSIISETVSRYGVSGISAGWSEKRPFYCSRFVKQVFQKAFKKYAPSIDDSLFGYSAYDTERKWHERGFLLSINQVNASGGLKEGDVLFQNYPVWGHVGVLVRKNNAFYVAENTVRYGLSKADYRALTPLNKFGKIRSVGRLTSL